MAQVGQQVWGTFSRCVTHWRQIQHVLHPIPTRYWKWDVVGLQVHHTGWKKKSALWIHIMGNFGHLCPWYEPLLSTLWTSLNFHRISDLNWQFQRIIRSLHSYDGSTPTRTQRETTCKKLIVIVGILSAFQTGLVSQAQPSLKHKMSKSCLCAAQVHMLKGISALPYQTTSLWQRIDWHRVVQHHLGYFSTSRSMFAQNFRRDILLFPWQTTQNLDSAGAQS